MTRRQPSKAIVLAAGYGTRLLPATRALPKPLMPLWGVPLLEHTLHLLQRWDVKDVLINCHHGADELIHFIKRYALDSGLSIAISFEPTILGTGGALIKARWFLDQHPFWLINADIAIDVNPQPFIHAIQSHTSLAAVWLNADRGPKTVEAMRGYVRTFTSKRPGTNNTYTFCGLHLLKPAIFSYLPKKEQFCSIIDAYTKAMHARQRIAAVSPANTYWADLGTPKAYLDAHYDVKKRYKKGIIRKAAL